MSDSEWADAGGAGLAPQGMLFLCASLHGGPWSLAQWGKSGPNSTFLPAS
jgi:hypothetical protein